MMHGHTYIKFDIILFLLLFLLLFLYYCKELLLEAQVKYALTLYLLTWRIW